MKTPGELWRDYCDVAPDLRERFGLASSLDYVVGDKLMAFAHMAELDEACRAELPAFCSKNRAMFTNAEIEGHFDKAEKESLVEADLLVGASAEEVEELREVLLDAQQDRERRSWVKAMLLRTGS
jgi:hypothetical protein